MKLEHMQALLDDFCIPLQLATGDTQECEPASKEKVSAADGPSSWQRECRLCCMATSMVVKFVLIHM